MANRGVVEAGWSAELLNHRLGQRPGRQEPHRVERGLVQLHQAIDQVGVILEVAAGPDCSILPTVA